jgi:hypothetical protein
MGRPGLLAALTDHGLFLRLLRKPRRVLADSSMPR